MHQGSTLPDANGAKYIVEFFEWQSSSTASCGGWTTRCWSPHPASAATPTFPRRGPQFLDNACNPRLAFAALPSKIACDAFVSSGSRKRNAGLPTPHLIWNTPDGWPAAHRGHASAGRPAYAPGSGARVNSQQHHYPRSQQNQHHAHRLQAPAASCASARHWHRHRRARELSIAWRSTPARWRARPRQRLPQSVSNRAGQDQSSRRSTRRRERVFVCFNVPNNFATVCARFQRSKPPVAAALARKMPKHRSTRARRADSKAVISRGCSVAVMAPFYGPRFACP